MKHASFKTVSKILGIFLLLITIWTNAQFLSHSLQPTHCQMYVEGFIAEHLRAMLMQELESACKQRLSLAEIRKKLTTVCPLVTSVSLRLTPQRAMIMWVTTTRPLMVINKRFVMTDHHRIVPTDFYPEQALNGLVHLACPNFNLDKTQQWLHNFNDFLTALPAELYDDFMLTIYDTTYIKLHDLHDTSWSLVCSKEDRLTDQVISAYRSIKQEHRHQPAPYTVDMRFKDMLVLAPDRR